MKSPATRPAACLILLLWTLAHAWVLPFREHADHPDLSKYPLLFSRADECAPIPATWDPETPRCIKLCSPSTCGASSSPSKRDDYIAQVSDGARNSSFSLEKRMQDYITQGYLPAYLGQNLHGGPYASIYGAPLGREGSPLPLITGGTGTWHAPYDGAPFALGTAGFHGCTGIVIVSNRAVFMAHTWEVPSWTGDQSTFKADVLDYFNGEIPSGSAPALTTSLFNQPGDNTKIHIFHPRVFNSVYVDSQYKQKLALLRAVLLNALPQASIATYNYNRLNYNSALDLNAAGTSTYSDYQMSLTTERGGILFQYDPRGTDDGQQDWRLFMERIMFEGSDTRPYAEEMRFGVQDLPAR
ncbi:hypothetical protein K461DRAFT_269867 [Myriangium duriaei CBS 260.36]|uniref:Uncharacterized protein n=1 Tax=Myriangium duriaei CBS 260.36 TaxID=1168546 RepID=A0A9P4IUX0_9PEZI|nr:hypothetical protein K461DRAFT_269867 [Myriangium duriaei CBS 260.36]